MCESLMDKLQISSISELVIGSLETVHIMTDVANQGYNIACMVNEETKNMIIITGHMENHVLNKLQLQPVIRTISDDVIPFQPKHK